jgi:hypothetical protein
MEIIAGFMFMLIRPFIQIYGLNGLSKSKPGIPTGRLPYERNHTQKTLGGFPVKV